MQQIACTLPPRIISASDKAEFRGAHGSGQSHHHGATLVDVMRIGTRGIEQRRGIEVAIVSFDECAESTRTHP